jgi:hypothetical protein
LTLENHAVLAKYLLGDLPEPERERLEKEYFVNDEAWELLTSVENDLIDSYLRGRLSERDEKQFETYFLQSPRRRNQFEFSRLLLDPALRPISKEAIPSGTQQKSGNRKIGRSKWISIPAQAQAASVLLAVVTAAILGFRNHRLNIQLERAQSDQAILQTEVRNLRSVSTRTNSPQNEHDTNEMPAISQRPAISMLLEPGNLRAAGTGNAHSIPRLAATPATIVLALDLARDEYPQYTAKIQTSVGHSIREASGLRSRPIEGGGRAVLFTFPSDSLANGDYIVWLSGQAGSGQSKMVDSYLFSISD